MSSEQIRIRCLELIQPIGKFYIGVMDAADVVRISFADVRRIDKELDDYLGIQRKLSPKRVEELQRYVKQVDATFPTSVILAISSDNAYYDRNTDIMSIVNAPDVAKIIDGQHRISGLDGFSNGRFQLNVTIFIDMEIEDQAMVFATINLAQTKVNKSLVYDLYEYTQSRSPQKTSHNIARLLNGKEGSPFQGRIKVLGEASAAAGARYLQLITQATFVEALIGLISGSMKQAAADRDQLKRKKRLSKPTSEELDVLIFRDMFRLRQDAEIARIVWEYFSAVRDRWPVSWEGVTVTGNILPRTNGFRALMRLMPFAFRESDGRKKPPQKADFLRLLQRIMIPDGAFTVDNYKPGTSGEANLFQDLLGGIGFDVVDLEEPG